MYHMTLIALSAKKKGSYGLILTLFSLSKWRLFETLPIQAASIFFKYAQIYIISEAIEYLDTPSLSKNPSKPPRLIICSVIVYFGNAVSIYSVYVKIHGTYEYCRYRSTYLTNNLLE